MSKNKGTQYERKEWLARRASPSMGRVLRSRGRYRYISAPLLVVDKDKPTEHRILNKKGNSTFIDKPEMYRLCAKGRDVIKGRNQRKRAHRATKSSRAFWRVVA